MLGTVTSVLWPWLLAKTPHNSFRHSLCARTRQLPIQCHLPPEVNYSTCFENDDLPCRLHEKHVVCRVNHHSRNRVNKSLQVAGGVLCMVAMRGRSRCSAAEREKNYLTGFQDLCLSNSSGQDPNWASTVLFVPNSIYSGTEFAA